MEDYELKRVRYEKSPLVEVIFQLQFPTILTINSNQPVDFQERVRVKYPFFDEEGGIMYNPQNNATALLRTAKSKNYAFISEDYKTKINLTPSFIAISTVSYTQWEEFRNSIEFVIPVFEEIYKPSFYTRVGLRYSDVITKSELGIKDKPWTELVKSHVLGMIASANEVGVKSYLSETEYETKIKGVISRAHFEFVHVNDLPELSLLIDCDYYSVGIITSAEVMKAKLDNLHKASSQFIQTAITKELHEAMKPEEI